MGTIDERYPDLSHPEIDRIIGDYFTEWLFDRIDEKRGKKYPQGQTAVNITRNMCI